jgi:hypothetical protein
MHIKLAFFVKSYNALALSALKLLIRASHRFRIRRRVCAILVNLIGYTYEPFGEEPFCPSWTRSMYKNFFQSIMIEMREVISDAGSFKDDPTFICVVFDMITYALGSQNMTQLVNSNVITEAMILFQSHVREHPIKCHQVVSVVISKLEAHVPLNNITLLLDSGKYVLLLHQIKFILSFLLDHYRITMDIAHKKTLLFDLTHFVDFICRIHAVLQVNESSIMGELPMIYHALFDEFITKSILYDFMENFEVNITLQGTYKEIIEVTRFEERKNFNFQNVKFQF